jgi:ribosomal protein S18 acetylase RimI-like enzyme
MSADLGVRRATSADLHELAGVLARAFFDDPVIMWMLPGEGRRRRMSELAYRTFLKRIYLPNNEVYTDSERRGAALWSPPGRWRIPLRAQLRMSPQLVRIFGTRLPKIVRGLNQIEHVHPDAVPHWHLGILGTDPASQGHGVGSAVMAPILARCDAEGVPAYLESSKHANIAFYRRHGFEVTDTVALPDGPDLWGMWREPRVGDEGTNDGWN